MANDEAATSPSLIQGIQADDPDAWRRMVHLYAPLVYSWCRRADLGPEDAADTVQEVLLAAWAGIGGFRRERPADTFRGWLRIIARNKMVDRLRRDGDAPDARGGTSAQLQMLQVAAVEDGDAEVTRETADLFARAMELVRHDFEEHTQQAFWLTTFEGQSAQEVAEQLGMTSGGVRQAKYKVLRRLRQELGDIV